MIFSDFAVRKCAFCVGANVQSTVARAAWHDHYRLARAFAVKPARRKSGAPLGASGLTAQRRQARGRLCYERRELVVQKPSLIFQTRGTQGKPLSKKRTSGHPTGSFLRREAKNPAQADRKPLARSGAIGARSLAACSLRGSKLDADRESEFWRPVDTHCRVCFDCR